MFTGCDGRYGSEGQLRRRRGPVQERYSDSEIPHRARNHHQLGRHGEDLAPHLLQWVESRPRGTPHPSDRGSPQPQGQQGEDDPDHVWDLQHTRHVRRHSGRALPVRFRSYHRYRAGLRWRCLPHSPHLWRYATHSLYTDLTKTKTSLFAFSTSLMSRLSHLYIFYNKKTPGINESLYYY